MLNRSAFLPIRGESGSLLSPADIGARVENMYLTEEGTLASVEGPSPYVPNYGSGYPSYTNPHGIYHCLLMGGTRDVLLIHTGSAIRVHDGFNRTWRTLIGPVGSGAQLETSMPHSGGVQYPLQCESTPTGVVIIPQGGRAFFYDGEVVLPLGYDRSPPAPRGIGPRSSTDAVADANDSGYSLSRSGGGYDIAPEFGYGRIGTGLNSMNGSSAGGILACELQAAVQWVDYFGNLSPISPRSNVVALSTQWTVDYKPERYQKQIVWDGIENGPTGTIGKDLLRTRDMLNSGTTDLFAVPSAVGGVIAGAYATIPDNSARRFGDNTPDSALVTQVPSPMPVPAARLCRYGFGRLWLASTPDDPGILAPSMVGRYGTFLEEDVVFPDGLGAELTGLWMSDFGLIVTSDFSTFLVTPSDAGNDTFRCATIDSEKGACSPSSFASMPDGSVIWLSRGGFVTMKGGKPEYIGSPDNAELLRRVNWGRAKQVTAYYDPNYREYRCFVPIDGSATNNMCIVYDGVNWRRRTDVEPVQVCVTKDHRRYAIAIGKSTDSDGTRSDGVWILDRQNASYTPQARTATIETSWINGQVGPDRNSSRTCHLWLRETRTTTATITVYRDWDAGTAVATDTTQARLYREDPASPQWSTFVLGSTTAPNRFVRRRPFWRKAEFAVASADCYKLKIEATGRFEFIGVKFDGLPQPGTARERA